METYTLDDFMAYPLRAFKLAMITPFTWQGADGKRQVHGSWIWQLWLTYGILTLIYEIVGMSIYLFAPPAVDSEEVPFLGRFFETFSIVCYLTIGACKMLNMLWHRKRITQLLTELTEIFPTPAMQQTAVVERGGKRARYRVERFAEKMRQLMTSNGFIFLFSMTFYNMVPMLQLLYELCFERALFSYLVQSNAWFPWHAENGAPATAWGFLATYLIQWQSSLTGVSFIIASEFMFCFFMTQMQLHFDYLAHAVEALDARAPTALEELKVLIVYHKRLLRFSSEINNIFNVSFLVNLSISSISLCMMGLTCVMIDILTAIKFWPGVLFFLVLNYFFCFNGSEFTRQSNKVLPAIYYGNWYEGNLAYRKIVYYFIMRLSEENIIMVYNYIPVSMETYMEILKFSYQLFTFFRTME